MRFKYSLLVLAMSGVLAACGGSDDTPDNGGGDNTGSTTTVVTEGVITGFGSVYVNGQRYTSDNANIDVGNNTSADESMLRVGMVVKVAASATDDGSDPEANQITYEESLQGPVSFIDRTAETLTVLGQTVQFDELTAFEDTNATMLSLGDLVEVSGYINEDGDFYATLIEVESDEDEMKLRGNVSALDTSTQTFKINELVIDYSGTEFDDMTADDLADGLFVKVEGTEFNADTMTLTATEVENKSNTDFDDDINEITIAGMVRDYDVDDATFTVNQYHFALDTDTEFEDGSLDLLSNGMIVKIEAHLDGDELIADEIEFKAMTARSKTEGQVTDVNSDDNTFVVNGTTFMVTADTRYDDDSDLDERRFTFDNIAVNDWLEVVSKQDDNDNTVALKVERINENERDGELTGVATDVTADGMMLGNVSVVFNEDTEFEADDDLTVDEFVTLAGEQDALRVEVEGEYDGDTLEAMEVEVESDDDDADDNTGRIEFKGQVQSIDMDNQSVMIQGNEVRFTQNSELELNDDTADVTTFLSALSEGTVLEVEGVWVEETFIEVKEAEVENEDDDSEE
ncbi:DUF5666 domain-containing protein [Idiomarina piscisalsi]|uniref:DUF5666 domain-containing protein n=1 Tax=Idiomarina piscisalsi TaxID=1096243 RepID=A0A432YR22_9GAMM|nr:DUF5666 domain-containing protein [Idiomarina piscisalsi]RUO64113.1 hypothetical protein CWI73_09300 [Idiomarina piscisalsi]